jgi:phage terminase large subunit
VIPREDLEAIFRRSYYDPAFFCAHVLRVELRGWQRQALEEIRQRMARGERRLRVLVRSCHGSGKTFLAACLVLWWVATRPEARGLTTAPSWAVVENTLWPEIRRVYNGSLLRPLRFGRMLDTELQVRDAWYVVGAASDKPDKLEGHHSPTAAIRVVDEAKAVEQGVIDSTEGMLDAPETMDVWISTPSLASGAFYDRDTTGGDSVIRIVVTVDDLIADGIPGKAEWKAERIAEWGETSPTYRARCMAEYLDDAEGALFPLSWIERAMGHEWRVLGQPTVGFDVAGSVDGDESAVAEVYGPDDDERIEVRDVRGWQERDTQLSKGRVLAFARDTKAKKIRVDVIGIGKGVKDALDHEKDAPLIEEYRASDKPLDSDRFTNRKAEDAWTMRDRLEKGLVRLPVDDLLRKQLAEMKYEITAAGKIKVVDPDDSPDRADAILIAAAGRGRVAGAGWLDLLEKKAAKKVAA